MKEDTKQKILISALEVFSGHSYHAASMTMIAEEAGVSKGTLYWHFESKEDLFRELVINGLDYFSSEFREIASKDISADEKIHEVINFGVKILVENSRMANILRNNVQLISADFQKRVEKKHEENVEIFTGIIEQGMEEGLIEKNNARNTAVMMMVVLFTSNASWLLDEITDTEKQVEFIYNFIMHGICRKEN